MRKMCHYFVCALNLVKKYFSKFFVSVRFEYGKLNAKRLVKKRLKNLKPSNSIKTPLSEFYADKGNLCSQKGFLNEASLDLSIIIPIYNVEKYIEECLDSVLNQKIDYSFEILIVDDGSPDNSVKKVGKYLGDNVKLISQKNGGQSVARNNALSQIKGRYVMMLDADDVMVDGAVNALMKIATETDSDIVEGGVYRFSDDYNPPVTAKYFSAKIKFRSNQINPDFVLSTFGYSIAKVYKRYLWETLRYPEGYIFEDVISKFILRRNANKVAFLNAPVYGYRFNPNSSTRSGNILKVLDSIWVLPKVIKLVEEENAPKDKIFYMLCLNQIGILSFTTVALQNEDVKLSAFEEMKNQLLSISAYKPKKMPYMFKALEKSILEGSIEDWEFICGIIVKYNLLKKWREIN